MPETRGQWGRRRTRLDERRRGRSDGYGRFLGLSALGTLVPGTGLLAAGRRLWGALVLGLLVAGLLAGMAVVLFVPRPRLASLTGDREVLVVAGGVLAVVAVAWLLVAVISHHLLEPPGLRAWRRVLGAVVVIAMATVVLGPMALASRYAFVQRDLVSTITLPGGRSFSLTTPKDVTKEDPWATRPRINVLLLGRDDDEGREGSRTDTVILASIDTRSGHTVLFSLPRNLMDVPFPETSPLHEFYPDGFDGPGDESEYLLNAVYQNIPVLHPDVFQGVTDPGADAIKMAVSGALGLPVDYYVSINIEGFAMLIDALGGVTVDISQRLPIGNKLLPSGRCSTPKSWIEPGREVELDGYHAMWYARSRCTTDDYDRMRRQRCIMGAIIAQADPVTVLSRYEKVASATKQIVRTDIPEDLLPAFIELSLRVKDGEIESLPFTDKVISSGNPDYDLIQSLVQEALDAPGDPSPTRSPTPTPSPTVTNEPSPDPSASPTGPSEAEGVQALDRVC